MKLFYSLIISLLSVLGYSQTILHQQESTTRTVQDPQTVIMAPGFRATSGVSNPFVAKIGPGTENPGGGPSDSGAGAGNPSGTTAPPNKSFHDTKGNIEVNGAGQLQFTLPIALPPGIKSVAPQINLIYTSGSGNGIAGYGWNLSGITSISRTGKNIEKDGEVKSIQLDYSDYYSFNGQRLILKSGEYGKNGAEYVTEKYSNVKIKSVGTITGQVWQGPEYWEVTFEDGSQAWYGAKASGNSTARTPLEYNVVKWKDAQGNYITYNYLQSEKTFNYTQSGNVALISSIQWGGNENLNKSNFNEIIFNYDDINYVKRHSIEQSYVNGINLLQDELLHMIIVKSNGNQFKKYEITYKKDTNSTEYQFVDKITEYNSQNEISNPVVFDYTNSSSQGWAEKNSQFGQSQNGILGDFNGDGSIELLRYQLTAGAIQEGLYLQRSIFDDSNQAYSTPIYLGNSISETDFKNAIAINFKKNNIVYNKQGFVVYKKVLNSMTSKEDLELKFYIITDDNQLALDNIKIIPNNIYDRSEGTPVYNPHLPGDYTITTLGKMRDMDMNGDGLSEIVFELSDKYCTKTTDPNNTSLPIYTVNCNTSKRYLIIDIDENLQNNTSYSEIYFNQSNIDIFEEYKIGDFNGDGVQDFIRFDNNKLPYLITFKKNISGNYIINETEYRINNIPVKGVNKKAIVGDFNGDGKSDLLIPVSNNTYDWNIYFSTGVNFSEKLISGLAHFLNDNIVTSNNDGTGSIERTQHLSYDVNNDGKSDFISFKSKRVVQKQGNFTYSFERYFYNDINVKSINTTGNYYFSETSTSSILNDSFTEGPSRFTYNPHNPNMGGDSPTRFDLQALSGDFRLNKLINKLVLVSAPFNRIKFYNFYDVSKESQINAITQGDIKTEIEYKQLDSKLFPDFYNTTQNINYPFVEMGIISHGYIVSQLNQIGKKQDFRYRGFVNHLQGRNSIGFRQTTRSSWYADGYENTKIWSGIENDPLNYSVPIKEWSIRTNDESKIFPVDISENNTQLLSFKSTIYQTDKLLNGQVVTSSSIADIDKPKIVTAIVAKSTKSKNFLANNITNNTITYGEHYIPIQSISNDNNGYAITTSTLEYTHNPSGEGANYFIGRPRSKTKQISAYNDTKSNKEEYTYENNQLKALKSWNRDNSGYLQEAYTYDGFGNLIQKTISNSIDSQTQTIKTNYDDKGRFVVKKTDNLGLETNITYNNWGQILTQSDPLGNVLTNTYDNWGKLLKSKTNLGGTTTYQYERDSNSNIIVTQNDPDGDISKKYTNKLRQNYKVSTKAFGQGQFVSKTTVYDTLGRKIRDSEPYFEGQSPSQWNVLTYDDSVFPTKVTATSFNGKQMETTISGLTTTIKELNGYGRTNSKTTDALGNVLSSNDKGGTIQFTFNAAGEQIKAQYAENIVTTKYDAWGRKSEFNDPSNGTYKYEYDGFGQPKKIISPKGTKEYTYNNLGQLITQKELSTTDSGQATNKTITYSYDNKGRVISKSGTSKGKAYVSNVSYDPQGRVLSSSESSNDKYFIQKGITYDDKARVVSYEKQLYSSGILTKVNLENIYSTWNGELYQVKDKNSGKILWELKETNAKGQVLKAKLGAADINNLYDYNGFLTSINHSSAVKPSILQISYSFNAIKNELNSRTTGGDFSINETFDYDDNNRLINWTNPVTGIKPSSNRNVYDAKGRITQNDQVGTIKFENSAKIYQPTGMTLNAEGTQNYNNDLIQSVVYNENNDPVFIDGEKGDVAFQYGLTAMRQRVTYGGNFNSDGNGKFTKFYSEDGSFEVVKDNASGKEKHILYIGGTPYESDIIYLKNFEESSGSYKFLHKDYIGSILAISDEAGNKLEQRHFDAWGNFTHLKIGNGAIITDKNIINNTSLLLERGYTSHEHFAEVGIIHMNGRLYDSLLRRFLNADENIQDPYNTQNYNKYGYVMNNPLMFNDPSGEAFQFLLAWGLSTFWATVATGAIIGAAVGGASYIINAAISKNWSWGAFGSSILMGAVSGAIAGGISPGAFSASTGTLLTNAAGQVIASVLPAYDFKVLGVSFSISPSIAMGKGWGFGANISVTFRAGDVSLSYGFGTTNYAAHAGSGTSGWEFRRSLMLSYDDGNFGISLGSNRWDGLGLDSQTTGVLKSRYKDFGISYENDGTPFQKEINRIYNFGDGGDSYRTTGVSIGYKDFSVGINLFTGLRDYSSYEFENSGKWDGKSGKLGMPVCTNGTCYKYGLVNEQGPRYRMGALYIGYKNFRIGIDSDKHVRNTFQNRWTHNARFAAQRAFEIIDFSTKPYFQYQSKNMFTTW